jgi:D-alanine-D-alanine ligase
MDKINKIAVLYGGLSSEREISLKSGMGVHKAICDLGYESGLIDFKDLNNLYELKIYDFIFIALHGFEGESGKLQKDLNDLNILYSGSGPEACSKTWNKKITKKILKENDINTPISIGISEFSYQVANNGLNISPYDCFRPFNYLFLKPDEDGSSIDIFKISDDESLKNAYKKCTNNKRGFLFEEYIEGRELTVTVIDKECFPPIEIITKNEFYDYDAKYISDDTLHVEAELTQKELDEIKSIAMNAFEVLDCKAWARVDMIQDKKGKFYVIEINTVPGMTSHSNVPKSGSLLGLTYNEVVQKIIDASL